MNSDRIYYSHDAETHAVREMARATLLCLMFGLGIGAVLALLFAPSSGKKVRDDLANTVEEGLNNGRDAVEPMVKRLEKEFDELRKSVEERLNQS
jgi:gas vesicle protein